MAPWSRWDSRRSDEGLGGARVVLVDDDVTEAMPVIKAFSKAGVPVAYFDGTESECCRLTGRLRGVRLAILGHGSWCRRASRKTRHRRLVGVLATNHRSKTTVHTESLIWTNIRN